MNRQASCIIVVCVAAAFALVTGCASVFSEPAAKGALACANPAPLIGANERPDADRIVDEYLVLLRRGTNVNQESSRLAAAYGFVVRETFWVTPSFRADLPPQAVANLRCEPLVQSVQFSRTTVPPP